MGKSFLISGWFLINDLPGLLIFINQEAGNKKKKERIVQRNVFSKNIPTYLRFGIQVSLILCDELSDEGCKDFLPQVASSLKIRCIDLKMGKKYSIEVKFPELIFQSVIL